MPNDKSYNHVASLSTFRMRYEYLRLKSRVGKETFGSSRYMNQAFYTSKTWKSARNRAIIRDNGCDLGCEGYEIYDKIYVHHINPITLEDIENESPKLYDLNNLICCSYSTHLAIHYGDEALLPPELKTRTSGDTKLW